MLGQASSNFGIWYSMQDWHALLPRTLTYSYATFNSLLSWNVAFIFPQCFIYTPFSFEDILCSHCFSLFPSLFLFLIVYTNRMILDCFINKCTSCEMHCSGLSMFTFVLRIHVHGTEIVLLLVLSHALTICFIISFYFYGCKTNKESRQT